MAEPASPQANGVVQVQDVKCNGDGMGSLFATVSTMSFLAWWRRVAPQQFLSIH